jgi:hypothetical protein
MSSQKDSYQKRLFGRLSFLILPALLIGGIVYSLSVHNYTNQIVYKANNHQSLNVTAARGDSFIFALPLPLEPGAIGDYWASTNGLTMKLDGVNIPLTVVEPKAQTWNDTINVSLSANPNSSSSSPSLITGNVTIPSSIGGPEEQVLSGTVSGEIFYPILHSAIDFTDQTTTITIPIHLHLVPRLNNLWSNGYLFFVFGAALLFLICLGTLSLAVWALASVFANKPVIVPGDPIRVARSGFKRAIQAILRVIGAIFLVLFVTGLSWGLLALVTSVDQVPSPDPIMLLNLLFPGMIGLSMLANVVARNKMRRRIPEA